MKFKAFADDKLNIAKIVISFFDRIEHLVGKGESVSYQHFLLFPQCFQNAYLPGSFKVGIVWYRVTRLKKVDIMDSYNEWLDWYHLLLH